MFILYFEIFDIEENLVNIGIKTVCIIKQTSKVISSLILKIMNSFTSLGAGLPKKWKFFIKFAIKEGGGGSRVHFFPSNIVFLKNHLELLPDCQNVFFT